MLITTYMAIKLLIYNHKDSNDDIIINHYMWFLTKTDVYIELIFLANVSTNSRSSQRGTSALKPLWSWKWKALTSPLSGTGRKRKCATAFLKCQTRPRKVLGSSSSPCEVPRLVIDCLDMPHSDICSIESRGIDFRHASLGTISKPSKQLSNMVASKGPL